MVRTILMLVLAVGLGGCGGEFILSVPDTVTTVGQNAPVVVRLQQQEFWRLARPMEDALMQVWALPKQKRAAYTSKQGYASAAVPVAERLGPHTLTVCHQDDRGNEVCRNGTIFVLDDRLAVLAIGWEAIEDEQDARAAAEPLRRLQQGGIQIVYLATHLAARPGEAHRWLSRHNLPDGPVLSWGWRRNWYFKAVQVTGSLPIARRMLPGMMIAAGREDDLLRAAEQAGMVAIHVGAGRGEQFGQVANWAELAERIGRAETLKGAKDFSKIERRAVRASVLGGAE